MTVWKYPLNTTDEQELEIPEINRPLCIHVQGGRPCLWVLVDPDVPILTVRVRIFGTGHPGVTADMDYVGSYLLSGGSLVFHVFMAGAAVDNAS